MNLPGGVDAALPGVRVSPPQAEVEKDEARCLSFIWLQMGKGGDQNEPPALRLPVQPGMLEKKISPQ